MEDLRDKGGGRDFRNGWMGVRNWREGHCNVDGGLEEEWSDLRNRERSKEWGWKLKKWG